MPVLMVPVDQLRAEIDERIKRGHELIEQLIGDDDELKARRSAFNTWSEYNKALLLRSFDSASLSEEYGNRLGVRAVAGRRDLEARKQTLIDDITAKIRRLNSIKERLELFPLSHDVAMTAVPPPDSSVIGEDIFVVHGHDNEAKHAVARFLSNLVSREPLILHELADMGRTIIEKFEDHAASAAYAVIILTGDDVGGEKNGELQPRARQNVVLELGFFLGKLGRDRVAILYEPEVELPSDLQGVLYIELDKSGGWRNAVARELQACGLQVELRALLSN
ncbi:nucleotide-binding protein [Amycolatopsis sp. NPDC051102]|uniref:nucleotide-binding protein n=1 Tax=Amycolatopsis sp. NPDC051102 TaxID=3155163 RepID=UPI00343BF3BF